MKLLYLCNNDGSDPRINKEIRTLSTCFQIDYVGMYDRDGYHFITPYVHQLYLIKSGRKDWKGLVRYVWLVAKLLRSNRYHSIHLVNETILILCFPLLWRVKSRKVLDLFDSIFLRLNLSREKCRLLKSLLYSSVNQILVTDQTRRDLLPSRWQAKALILPNYPWRLEKKVGREVDSAYVTLFYYGWFGQNRGSDLLLHLLQTHGEKVRVMMAGWFGDQESKRLLHYEQVCYWGILPQEEAMKKAARYADYIVCVYKPINENNRFASPNKVYDAIQLGVPLLMNSEVGIAQWVEDMKLGIVLADYSCESIDQAFAQLVERKGKFTFSDALKNDYCWEKVQAQLLNAHLG